MTSGDVYRVFRVGIRGDLELQIDVPLTPPAVDRADVTREVERILGRVERPALSRSQKLALEEAGASEFHPLITDVKAAADGGVWVRGVAKPNQIAVRWTYFDDEGDLLGYLFVSATARLLDATRSEMLMVDRDSLDTPFISWWLIENGS